MTQKSKVDPDCYARALVQKKNKEHQIEFRNSIVALAHVCKFTLTPEVMQIYDRVLSQFGYDAACKGIQAAICSRKGSDGFPSVAEIVSLTSSTDYDQASAIAIADKVWQAVANWGWVGVDGAKNAVGEVGAEVIDSVGWPFLCSSEMNDAGTIKAQLRTTAQSVIDKRRKKLIDRIIGRSTLPALSQDREASFQPQQLEDSLDGQKQGHEGVGHTHSLSDPVEAPHSPIKDGPGHLLKTF